MSGSWIVFWKMMMVAWLEVILLSSAWLLAMKRCSKHLCLRESVVVSSCEQLKSLHVGVYVRFLSQAYENPRPFDERVSHSACSSPRTQIFRESRFWKLNFWKLHFGAGSPVLELRKNHHLAAQFLGFPAAQF